MIGIGIGLEEVHFIWAFTSTLLRFVVFSIGSRTDGETVKVSSLDVAHLQGVRVGVHCCKDLWFDLN